MSYLDLDLPPDHAWIRNYAPGAICQLGMLPRIPLPNSDRDSGRWCLGVDRKQAGATVLLYCDFGQPGQVYRRIASISNRRQLIALYDQLCGRDGAWTENVSKLKAQEVRP